MKTLAIAGAAVAALWCSGCTTEIGEFCSRVESCGLLRSAATEAGGCETAIEDLVQQANEDLDACKTALEGAARVQDCENFQAQDLCSLCNEATAFVVEGCFNE